MGCWTIELDGRAIEVVDGSLSDAGACAYGVTRVYLANIHEGDGKPILDERRAPITRSVPSRPSRRSACRPCRPFRDAESYYATLGHEAVHWTRHPLRLDLGLASEPGEDHAAYLAPWTKVLKGDSRAIVSAAVQAERAMAFLHGLQPGRAVP